MEGEVDLSLELSIGGCFAKPGNKNPERENETPAIDLEISRSDFCGGEKRNDECEFSDLRRKREIRALKRREARMKRDVKKSRGLNGGAGLFRAGVDERDTPGESPSKREKSGGESLSNFSLFGENKVALPMGSGFACPWVVPVFRGSYFAAGEVDAKSSGDETENVAAAAPCSSAVSPRRSTCKSHKGGSSSDSGSHSSSFGKYNDKVQNLDPESNATKPTIVASTTTNVNACPTIDKPTSLGRYRVQHNACPTTDEPMPLGRYCVQHNACPTIDEPTPLGRYHMQHNTCSTTEKPPPSPTSNINTHNQHMPCVSTTGNGPNAKTIVGFLYKYTKSEVSIMCVCHGSFFSPAQFVEHAGGVDITNPLRHITVVPSVVK